MNDLLNLREILDRHNLREILDRLKAAGVDPAMTSDEIMEMIRGSVPCSETVALAARRAGRWARDNTTLTAAEIIELDLAIRDLAGPT